MGLEVESKLDVCKCIAGVNDGIYSSFAPTWMEARHDEDTSSSGGI